MKKLLNLCLILLGITPALLFGQLENGEYAYSNSEVRLDFTITDDGFKISTVSVVYLKTTDKMKLTGTGEWFAVNYEWSRC